MTEGWFLFEHFKGSSIIKGCPHILSDFWPPSPLRLAHTCPDLPHPLFPFRANTNFENDTEISIKYLAPDIHLHHASPYTNNKKVSHKVNC